MSETYSSEAVQEILRVAAEIEKENEISKQQLEEIAAEVGISAQNLARAEKVWLESQEASQKRAKRRSRFIRFHLIPYLAVSVFLVLLNLFTTPRSLWSVYPLLGWGLGVSIDGACLYSQKLTGAKK